VNVDTTVDAARLEARATLASATRESLPGGLGSAWRRPTSIHRLKSVPPRSGVDTTVDAARLEACATLASDIGQVGDGGVTT